MVRDDHALMALLLVVAAISLSQDPVSTLTPGFSEEIFDRSDTVTGPAGRGVRRRCRRWRRPPPPAGPATPSVASPPAASSWAWPCSASRLAPNLPFALGALLVGGFCFMVTNTGATTALTLEVAPEQRGRVMALWSLCFLGTRPLASLVDGALASTAGLRPAGVALTVPVSPPGSASAARTPDRPPPRAASTFHARTDRGDPLPAKGDPMTDEPMVLTEGGARSS